MTPEHRRALIAEYGRAKDACRVAFADALVARGLSLDDATRLIDDADSSRPKCRTCLSTDIAHMVSYVDHQETCRQCGTTHGFQSPVGSYRAAAGLRRCPKCNGTHLHWKAWADADGAHDEIVDCTDCLMVADGWTVDAPTPKP